VGIDGIEDLYGRDFASFTVRPKNELTGTASDKFLNELIIPASVFFAPDTFKAIVKDADNKDVEKFFDFTEDATLDFEITLVSASGITPITSPTKKFSDYNGGKTVTYEASAENAVKISFDNTSSPDRAEKIAVTPSMTVAANITDKPNFEFAVSTDRDIILALTTGTFTASPAEAPRIWFRTYDTAAALETALFKGTGTTRRFSTWLELSQTSIWTLATSATGGTYKVPVSFASTVATGTSKYVLIAYETANADVKYYVLQAKKSGCKP